HGGTQKALTGFNASAPTQASIKSTENANPRAAATPIPYGTSAVVQGGATLTAGHAIGVTANESDSIRVDAGQIAAAEVAAGGVAAGVSFTNLNLTGGANSFVGDNADIGQTGAVHSLKVLASSTITAKTETFAVSAGIGAFAVNFAYDNVTPSVDATI